MKRGRCPRADPYNSGVRSVFKVAPGSLAVIIAAPYARRVGFGRGARVKWSVAPSGRSLILEPAPLTDRKTDAESQKGRGTSSLPPSEVEAHVARPTLVPA
jgi:hypothetical protein